jgi:signal transduction histidine kinase
VLVANFKRVAVDTATAERRRIALVPYLEQTVESLRPLTRRRAVEVVVSGETFERTTFPGALAQIVTNFVSNTVEHGARDDGGPTRATLEVVRLDGGRVRITYADDGRGMSEEVRRQAFVPFFSTRRNEGGTGLGLHIVQTLVGDVLHGTLALETTEGDGVRFVIELPAEDADAPPMSRA